MRHRGLWIVAAGLAASLALAAAKKEAQPEPRGGENEGAEELNMLRGRAQWWFERHLGPDGVVPWNARANALVQLHSNVRSGRLSVKQTATTASSAIEGDVWLPIGPRPINDGSFAYAGRVTALATVPGSPNTVYLGAAQGGVWKTVDGGTSWVPLTDDQDTLAIGSLAVDPSNSNVIYAGTGEANQSCDSHYGVGLLRSGDGGATWTTLGNSTFQNTSIAKVVVHPTVPTTLWVANGSGAGGFSCYGRSGTFGVYKSTDSGTSWSLVLGQAQTGVNLSVHDLIRSPSNPDTLYAAVRTSGIWKTTDGGSAWVKLAGGLPTEDVGRLDLAVNPTNGSVLFALIEKQSNGRQLGTYRSTNAGANWTQLQMPTPMTCHYWSFSDLCTYSGNSSGQCWYDAVIEVQPGGTVWQGGSAILKSTTPSGDSWVGRCPQSVHVDQHAIAFGSDGRVWIGNDGGVWASSDGGMNWENMNGSLQITQFYPGAALDPSNYERAMGGTQDNGTPRYEGSLAWGLTTFGDGAACVIDASDPLTFYTSSQYLNIYKTTDGGFSFNDATNGLWDTNSSAAPFIGQFTACPANPGTLIAGSDNVWLTTNGADSWVSNSPDPIEPSGSRIVTLAFAALDSTCNTYAVGTRSGRVFRTTDGGASWINITADLPLRAVSDLAFDPTDPNVLYAAVSGFGGPHLYRTGDALSLSPTWFTADAGIPDAPINAILVDPHDPRVVYAGSDLGLFKSVDAGVSWGHQLNGIPRVAIHDLVADKTTRAFVAFTHGRGAFRLNLVCTPPQFSGVESASDSSACNAGTSVSWSAPAGWGQLASTGTYELQRFDGADCAGDITTVATGLLAETLAATDAGTTLGSMYSYRVIATNDCASPISDAGAIGCSQPVFDDADLVPCSEVGPTLLLSHDPTDATLTWDAVVCSDIQSYAVYAAASFDAPFPSGWTLLGSPGATTFTDPLVSAFVAYRVITLDACNNPSE